MWDRMPAGMGPRELVVQLRQRGAGPEVAEEAQVTTAARERQRWWERRRRRRHRLARALARRRTSRVPLVSVACCTASRPGHSQAACGAVDDSGPADRGAESVSALLEQLGKTEDLPESVRSLMAQATKATARQEAKTLRRLVAQRSEAVASLEKIRQERSSYQPAWANYAQTLLDTVLEQVSNGGPRRSGCSVWQKPAGTSRRPRVEVPDARWKWTRRSWMRYLHRRTSCPTGRQARTDRRDEPEAGCCSEGEGCRPKQRRTEGCLPVAEATQQGWRRGRRPGEGDGQKRPQRDAIIAIYQSWQGWRKAFFFCLGPWSSLRGPHGPVPHHGHLEHSVRFEMDYVCPEFARVLAVQLDSEVLMHAQTIPWRVTGIGGWLAQQGSRPRWAPSQDPSKTSQPSIHKNPLPSCAMAGFITPSHGQARSMQAACAVPYPNLRA